MSIAPSNKLAACLEVMYRAALRARALGWSGERNGLSPAQASELAALMDAIHNIPHLLQRWESCDEEALRATLEAFDAKFSERGRGLVAIYDGVSGGAG